MIDKIARSAKSVKSADWVTDRAILKDAIASKKSLGVLG